MNTTDKEIDLIDDAYKNYLRKCVDIKWMKENVFYDGSSNHHLYLQEEFINKVKMDEKFSQKWDITIETRELSLLERRDIARVEVPPGKLDPPTNWSKVIADGHYHSTYDYFNIPTKLTTINYNGQTQEIYE